MPTIVDQMQGWKQMVEETLGKRLASSAPALSVLFESMRYSVFAGGKRLRPSLVFATGQTLGANPQQLLSAACALECIHTYSLIHDDLPAMDDDDLRRGMPTNHKVYGEAIAILAGDGLLTFAFQLLSEDSSLDPSTALAMIRELSVAAGAEGMVGGQAVDIASEGVQPSEELLEIIHPRKTGALLVASARLGALAAHGTPAELEAVTTFATELGVAFQIMDDILDVVGETEKLGKTVGSDAAHDKLTYPRVFGLERSRALLEEHSRKAQDVLDALEVEAPLLEQLLDFLANRDH